MRKTRYSGQHSAQGLASLLYVDGFRQDNLGTWRKDGMIAVITPLRHAIKSNAANVNKHAAFTYSVKFVLGTALDKLATIPKTAD